MARNSVNMNNRTRTSALINSSMVHSDNISDFILELITYAKDEDIIALLEYIPNKTVVNSQPKSLLIENIFSPLYHSVQYSLNNLPVEITFKKVDFPAPLAPIIP